MQKRYKTKRKSTIRHDSSSRSWDESSDPESFDFSRTITRRGSSPRNNNIVVSNLTGNIVSDSVVLNIEDETEENSSTSNESHSDVDDDEDKDKGGDEDNAIGNEEEEEEEDEELSHTDWEVQMLRAELEKRKSVTELPSDIDESDGLLRRRKRRSDTDTDASETERGTSRPRAASLDQHNIRQQQYRCRGVFKAMSFDRNKDQL